MVCALVISLKRSVASSKLSEFLSVEAQIVIETDTFHLTFDPIDQLAWMPFQRKLSICSLDVIRIGISSYS
jgi:hypothetical protein